MRRLFFLATGMLWSTMTFAGYYKDFGRWYSHTNGFGILILCVLAIILTIVFISALVQKLRNDDNWKAGGCFVVVVIASIIFVAFMSNMEKSRKKDSPTQQYTPSTSNVIHDDYVNSTNSNSYNTYQPNMDHSTGKKSQRVCGHCKGEGQVAGLEEVDVVEDCPHCEGFKKCDFCSGRGYIDMSDKTYPCSICEGTGKLPSKCIFCSSTGKISRKKTVEVTVDCVFCNGTGYVND